MALIIHTDIMVYTMAYIIHEDEDFLTIVVTNEKGEEFPKIIPKHTILAVDVIYEQMITPPKNSKGDVSYA